MFIKNSKLQPAIGGHFKTSPEKAGSGQDSQEGEWRESTQLL